MSGRTVKNNEPLWFGKITLKRFTTQAKKKNKGMGKVNIDFISKSWKEEHTINLRVFYPREKEIRS